MMITYIFKWPHKCPGRIRISNLLTSRISIIVQDPRSRKEYWRLQITDFVFVHHYNPWSLSSHEIVRIQYEWRNDVEVQYRYLFSGMVGRMLAPGTVLVFREAVSRLQSPDLVSRGLAAELLADQEQPHAIQQLLARLHQIQDLARYK